MFIIGFDVGGTKIEATLFRFQDQASFAHTVLAKKRVATERHRGYEQILEKMVTLVKSICKEKKITPKYLSGIGLSVPGPVHPDTEELTSSNSMILVGHRLHHDLRDKLKLSIQILAGNDANCFALAETLCGAGTLHALEHKVPVNKQTGVGIILGSGCGGGIVINGNILCGKSGGAGEIGHMTLYHDGWPCYCGRNGCAEQYLCGPALEAALQNRIYSHIEKRPDAAEIFELYKLQDPIALAVVKQYKKDLARFIGNLSNVLDPHFFVLGGGLSLQDVLYEDLAQMTSEHTFLSKQKICVYKHQIGDAAGGLGAALLVYNNINNAHYT